jgi:hypothetical protein
MTKLSSLLEFVRQERRVCPMPQRWNELYGMLSARLPKPAPPLILAAWADTSALMKMARLQEQIQQAADRGIIDEVDEFIRSLSEGDWAHLGEV